METTEEETLNPSDKEINEIKELLNKEKKEFKVPYVLRKLHEKDSLRKVFLSVVKDNPAKISEVCEYTLFFKQNCYAILNQLISFGLIERIFIADITNGKVKNDAVLNKFNEWSRTMPINTKRYYAGKTSYFQITDFGKKFIVKAYKFEQEFK